MKDDDTRGTGPRTIPLLPLRDIIVFPHMVVPLFVGREKSINALEQAMAGDKEIVLSAQKKAKTNDPTPDDIFKVLVEGKRRARLKKFVSSADADCFLVEVEEIQEPAESSVEIEALMR